MAAEEERRTVLERRAVAAGEEWAAETRLRVNGEQRLATGGWPGTVSEARARVAQVMSPLLARTGLGALTHDERKQMARVLYAAARESWLKHRQEES